MAISSLQNPKFQSRLNSGEVNDSGYIYVYTVSGTYNDPADQVTVWSDKAKTNPLSQPIQLDADGTKEIWFDGTVEIRVEESDTTLLDTIIGVESSPTVSVSGEFNLVTNGSFELDTDDDGAPDGWTLSPLTDATISIDSSTDDQSHGVQSLHFDSTGATGGAGTALSDMFAVERLASLTVRWSFKQTDAADGNYKVDVLYYDENGDYVGADNVWDYSGGAAPTTWTTYENEDASPVVDAGATHARIQLTGLGSTGTDKIGECWFDNVSCIDPLGLVTLTGTQTLTNNTLTDPIIECNVGELTIETIPVYSLVVLDTPELLTSATTSGSWVSTSGLASTTLSTASAVKAIVRISAQSASASATSESVSAYLRKAGTALGANSTTQIMIGNENLSAAGSINAHGSGEGLVNLDASSDFEYFISTTGTIAAVSVVLVGYYV